MRRQLVDMEPITIRVYNTTTARPRLVVACCVSRCCVAFAKRSRRIQTCPATTTRDTLPHLVRESIFIFRFVSCPGFRSQKFSSLSILARFCVFFFSSFFLFQKTINLSVYSSEDVAHYLSILFLSYLLENQSYCSIDAIMKIFNRQRNVILIIR